MKRRALLVDAGRATEDIVDGCAQDVVQMKRWLVINPGGAWDVAFEIRDLHNATVDKIEESKRWLDEADFALMAFSGHGRMIADSNSKVIRQTVLIGSNKEIWFDWFYPKAAKSIVICDACREVHLAPPELQLKAFSEMRKYAREAAKKYTSEDYRHVWWDRVKKHDGRFTIFSCKQGQCAGDDPVLGGLFTGMVLSRSGIWHDESTASGIRSISDAFHGAEPYVSQASRAVTPPYEQDPVASSGTRGSSSGGYPFGICLV